MGKFFQELQRRNVVRVVGAYLIVGWVLMQVATSLEESMNLPGWFDAVVVALLIVGLPIAIIVSWVFDLTAGGVVRTEGSPGGGANRKLNYLIGAALLVAGAIFAWQTFDAGEAEITADIPPTVLIEEIDAASIAVLPFADLSPEGDQEYFSDGISEEILNLLASVDALSVTSRTSAFQFKGRDLGIPEIAARLKVRHVVEGSIRKAGDTIRITAQLIDAEDDRHLWSDTFDRPLTAANIFAIQDEISRAIVDELGNALGIETTTRIAARRSTKNLTAYELFLRARQLYQSRTQLDVVDELLAEAVDQDSRFADAWGMRAANQFLMKGYDFIDTPQPEILRLTTMYADKALELDPRNSTAIAAKAYVGLRDAELLNGSQNYAELLANLTKAVDLDPRNDSALNWRGLLRLTLGDVEGALTDFKTCTEFEPLMTACGENYVTTLAGSGNDVESFAHFNKMLDNGIIKTREADMPMLARMSEKTAFKVVSNSADVLFGWNEHDALYDALRNPTADHKKIAHSLQQFLDANPERDILSVRIAQSYLDGSDERPIEVLTLWSNGGATFRQSDRFKDFIRSSGLLAYWQERGFPPQCRATGDRTFECD
jgi:TolB-like protein/tetratricopeptide (TPR) repeat protein